MSDSMSLSKLAASLQESLMDSAELFRDENDAFSVNELLQVAAEDLARIRRRTKIGSISLKPGEDIYEAPEDLTGFKHTLWGQQQRQTMKPWQPGYPRRLPSVSVTTDHPKYLVLSFSPSDLDIHQLGHEFRFFYFANHHLDEDSSKTTVSKNERGLLLLRAQAEAMKWLALRNVDKTVSAKHAISGASKGGVPGAIYKLLMEDWERRAAC